MEPSGDFTRLAAEENFSSPGTAQILSPVLRSSARKLSSPEPTKTRPFEIAGAAWMVSPVSNFQRGLRVSKSMQWMFPITSPTTIAPSATAASATQGLPRSCVHSMTGELKRFAFTRPWSCGPPRVTGQSVKTAGTTFVSVPAVAGACGLSQAAKKSSGSAATKRFMRERLAGKDS